jgi:hypothetical protein
MAALVDERRGMEVRVGKNSTVSKMREAQVFGM